MSKRVATLTVEVYLNKSNELFAKFLPPELLVDNKYDFVKLSLIAAELLSYVNNQCVVVNIDDGGVIKKMSELLIDPAGWEQHAQAHQIQTKLPFEEDKNAG